MSRNKIPTLQRKIKAKRVSNAMQCFAKVAETNLNKETIYSIGALLVGYERFEDALSCFEKMTGIDLNDGRGWEGKGICLSYLKRREEAVIACKKAMEINPKSDNARMTLSTVYLELGDYKSLVSLAEETVKLMPENIMAYAMLSEALVSSNNLSEAESILQKTLGVINKNEYVKMEELALVNQRLGIVLYMRGHKDDSKIAFQKAIDAQPGDIWGQELFSSFEILSNLTMQGTPVERQKRLLKLTQKRVDAHNGKGLSQSDLIMLRIYQNESPLTYLDREDSLLAVAGALLKVWPPDIFAGATKVALSVGCFESFQKKIEEIIMLE